LNDKATTFSHSNNCGGRLIQLRCVHFCSHDRSTLKAGPPKLSHRQCSLGHDAQHRAMCSPMFIVDSAVDIRPTRHHPLPPSNRAQLFSTTVHARENPPPPKGCKTAAHCVPVCRCATAVNSICKFKLQDGVAQENNFLGTYVAGRFFASREWHAAFTPSADAEYAGEQ
jgi:hypothetical protein